MITINSAQVASNFADVVINALDASLTAVDVDYVDPVVASEIAGSYECAIMAETGDTDDVKAPGSDVDVRDFNNAMAQLVIDQSVNDGIKLPQAFETMIPEARALKVMEVTKNTLVKVLRVFTAIKLDKATAYAKTDALTKSNIKDFILEHIGELNKQLIFPTHIELSADAYSTLKSALGSEFTPATNDAVEQTGQIGYWQGLKVIMNPLIGRDSTSFSYMDRASNGTVDKKAVDFSPFDYVLYDYKYVLRHDNLKGFKEASSPTGFTINLLAEIDFGVIIANSKALSTKKKLA